MKKSNRNDPCPCGSGKKYKKCCGSSNIIELNPNLYNEELELIHDDLIAFAMSNYEDVFIDQAEENYFPSMGNNEEIAETYLTGLTFWTIIHAPIVKEQTIFDIFQKSLKSKGIRTRTRNTFAEWANAVPSVYEVVSIDSKNTNQVTIKELLSSNEYQILILEDDEFIKGEILIGILVPFVGNHRFFFTAIEAYGDSKQSIVPIFEHFSKKEGGLTTHFPEFLSEVLSLEDEMAVQWNDPRHKMVGDLFIEHMVKKGIDPELTTVGLMTWHKYCQKTNPNIKKLGAYAAALDYFVQVYIAENEEVTQKQIAAEYTTAAGTVSANYRKLADSFEEDMISDEFMDDEPALPSHHRGALHMEKEMRNLKKFLEEQNFSSIEEANQFLSELLKNDGIPEPTSMSPRDQAQDILFDAQGASGPKRTQLIEKALKIYPNSPDAYLLLAEEAYSAEDFEDLVHQAVIVGEKDLGKAFFLENKGSFWMISETRPYMRAKAMYAAFMDENGNNKEAIKHYEEMIRLNPNDNQGVRYHLLPILIDEEKFDDAYKLIEQYADDGTANFLFNKALLTYLTEGITSNTKQLLKDAQKQNPFVKDYLTGKKRIPWDELEYIGFGDETEAIAYAQENIHLWDERYELLEEL